MNKFPLFLLTSLLFLSLTSAAFANDDQTPKLRETIKPVELNTEPIAKSAKTESSSTKSKDTREEKPEKKSKEKKDKQDIVGKSSSSSDVPIPARLASFTTGMVVGTPIAIARCMYKQTKSGATDLIGDKRHPALVIPAVFVSIPFAIMGGPFEGLGYATVNSWKGSGEEPFGQDSFSLGDWE